MHSGEEVYGKTEKSGVKDGHIPSYGPALPDGGIQTKSQSTSFTIGPKYRATRHNKLRDSTRSPKHGDIRKSSETLHVAPNIKPLEIRRSSLILKK